MDMKCTMAHQLVLVLVPGLQSSVVAQVEALLAPHIGDPAQPVLCFDYCKIGGRWNGVFAGMLAGDPAERDPMSSGVEGNICRVSDLPPDLDPGSVITPDGELHFFGWRFEEPLDRAGATLWKSIRQEHGSAYAVAVDGHS